MRRLQRLSLSLMTRMPLFSILTPFSFSFVGESFSSDVLRPCYFPKHISSSYNRHEIKDTRLMRQAFATRAQVSL